ncbi:MAG TPA: chloride channel protein [Symbiobacteriaceae bacterium]|nr:chloride channel protein [Symbiobacteriaceae bacterium]
MSRIRFRQVVPLSALVGVMVGLFGAAFYLVWHELEELVWEHLENPMHRIWVSGLIGLVIGLIIWKLWDPGTMGDIIGHFHHRGKLPMADNKPIIPISLVGLVGGSSAGPEGVLTQVCGTMGSWVAERFGHPDLVRVLTQAGMGAGFGAFLGAPVGGAMLWLEMPHKKGLEYFEALVPTITCSVVGHLVMTTLLGINLMPTWHLPNFTPSTRLDLVAAIGLGLVAGGAAILYAKIFQAVGAGFRALPVPVWVKTTLAGLIIGGLGAALPITYFYGRQQITDVITGSFAMPMLIGILLAKMLAAAVTIKGHWQGGLIIPHMFMGIVIGKAAALALPGLNPTLAMVVCMAAFNAAATHTPLASALIVVALSGFGGIVPIFIASLVGFFIGQRIELIGNKSHRTEWPVLEMVRRPDLAAAGD